jgi:hypothetical protein
VADQKVVFIAFAIEDERQRDFLKGQSLHPRAPYEFVDMSVKEPYNKEWKERKSACGREQTFQHDRERDLGKYHG